MAGASEDLNSESEATTVMSSINITPFVDVMLVLLIIFMITAPALVKEVMDIRLPKTSSGDGQVMQTLGVAINKDGNILLNGQITDEEGLKKSIGETLAKSHNTQTIINTNINGFNFSIRARKCSTTSVGVTFFWPIISRIRQAGCQVRESASSFAAASTPPNDMTAANPAAP